MANNNVQNVRFLRNGSLYETRDAALARLNGQNLTAEQDGSIILARYGSGNTVKTLVGFVYVNGENKSLTIFDIEGASGDVEKLRQEINAQLEALSGTSSSLSGDTSVWGAKKYADGLKNAMDYTGLTADENKVVYNVTEADGIVAAEAKNISSVKLAGYAVGSHDKIAATDTLGEALGKLQGQINGMDLTDTAVEGNYVSKVDEADGKIAVTRVALPTVDAFSETGKPITAVSESLGIISASAGTIYAQYVTTSTSNTDFTGETVQAALEEISSKVKADKITSADKTITVTTAATGTDVAVNIDGTTLVKNTSTGVISSDLKIKSIAQAAGSAYASQYQLVYGSSETPIGDVISVVKDQFLKEASYDATTQKLTLVMYNSTGGTTNIEVDFSSAIIEAEAGEGLYVKDDHSLNVGIASSSETVTISDGQGGSTKAAVLSVNADNIEVQNIQNAIDYKVSTLDATVGSTTVASDKHVAVQVSEADGVLTALTVTENDIASKSLLDGLSGKTVTEVASSNNSIEATLSDAADKTKHLDIITDASRIKMSGFTNANALTSIKESSSVTEALLNVDKVITEKEKVISTALDAEIAARKAVYGQNGDTYLANTSANYISGATSLNDADIKLNDALASLDTDVIKSVKVNDVKLAETSNAVNVQISSTPASGTSASPIIVNTDNTGAVTLQILQIDCGVY